MSHLPEPTVLTGGAHTVSPVAEQTQRSAARAGTDSSQFSSTPALVSIAARVDSATAESRSAPMAAQSRRKAETLALAETQISRFTDGLILLHMSLFAFLRIKAL